MRRMNGDRRQIAAIEVVQAAEVVIELTTALTSK
jgi:hypothetical protein